MNRKYPDFICIGAKKSATSWLRWLLNHHPEIWTAPKEVHYFDDSLKDPIIKRYLKFGKKDNISNQLIKYCILSILTNRSWDILRYYFRLIFFERNNNYYSSLFSDNDSKICGDVTPDYAIISENKIADISKLIPNLKIIYLLRNPVQRIWSHVAMQLSRHGRGGVEGTDDKIIKKFLDRENIARHSEYLKNISTWEKYFSNDQIFIGFYDQIEQNPNELFENIVLFLNLGSSQKSLKKNLDRKINSREYPKIPIHFENYLTNKYFDEILALHKKFNNNYTAVWLENATKTLNHKEDNYSSNS